MSASLVSQAQQFLSTTFQQQVAGALLNICNTVFSESTSVSNHTARLAFANAIVMQPMYYAAYMAPGLSYSSTILADIVAGITLSLSGTFCSDSDMQTAVNSIFNFYATQYGAQINNGVPLAL